MRRWYLAGAVMLLAFARGGMADPAPALSGEDRSALEQAVARSVESGKSQLWRGTSVRGAVSLGRLFSRETARECEGCSDPCRHIEYSVVAATYSASYQGVRCREDGGWKQTAVDQQTSFSSIPPAVQHEAATVGQTSNQTESTAPPPLAARSSRTVAEVQRVLKLLLYYRGPVNGVFGDTTQSALTEFLADERSSLQAAPGTEVLGLLHVAARRPVHGTCAKPAGVPAGGHIACTTLAD